MSRIVVFYDPSFPYAGERPNDSVLEALSKRCALANADELAGALEKADVLVHLHGSYFPKTAWPAVLSHLRSGKGLVTLGGAPFKTPVYSDNGSWVCEPDQTGYHQQLHIHEALPVDPAPIRTLECNRDIPLFRGREALFTIKPTCGLVLHVTRADDQPGQLGSAGPMDAHIYPLLKGIGSGPLKRELAAPAVLLENTKGDYAGGRWIFINQQIEALFWQGGGAEALVQWAVFASRGVTELWFKPNYASYEPGDKASLTVQAQRICGDSKLNAEWTFRLRVLKAKAPVCGEPQPTFVYDGEAFEQVYAAELNLAVGRELKFTKIQMAAAVEAGFYAAECEAVSAEGEIRILRQGFWGFDGGLLREGELLTCDRDYFRKEGKPFPIVGMTYMTSDVARKYLFLPNAAVWDRDMAQMKRAGINLIRTGIWTGWRHVMFVDGHAYEEVLRAVDAFILTAKRHGLEVTFNFFAFTPEAWEGTNPYLDPRSVEAQKRFIAAVVSRHAETTNVHWDLINEPSMFDPQRIFKKGPRSSHDHFEREAFIEFLRQRHRSIRVLQERWNMTPDELPGFAAAKLPEPEDIGFNTTESLAKKSGMWLDYTLFSMEMHNRWASQLIETIRDIQPAQLVTVGQDEGLGAQRPSPFFYAEAVDYTTVHSWWKMDDLVWDGVFAKTPDKPNVIQETGIMYVETPDGRAKRSEHELRNILERKYAYAFSTGGAGAVQWIWNTNFYMNNVNESNIGALRADGTEKPEADVSYDFGMFMESIRDLFTGRRLEETVVIFPYSNDFSSRPLAWDGTTRAVRTLAYEMNAHPRGLGEYHLDSLATDKPRLMIVPSAHNFSEAALQRLLEHLKEHGGTLLFTGPVGLDEYWRPAGRLSRELQAGPVTNLLREELLEVSGKLLPLSFGGSRIADACKQLVLGSDAALPDRLAEAQIGQGKLIWCPLPVELNGRTETIRAVYEYALQAAGAAGELEWLQGGELAGVYGRKLAFAHGSLFVFVSEAGYPAAISVRDPQTGRTYLFQLESERSVLFATEADGAIRAVYRPHEVEIRIEK
ncbi:beta-galactosidase [Paenibacillus thalictri]|uniref:Glycoside hydrolase n=1 Tax=Paenibacillus thalictri TaxID=2527873 RepID=A0A4Q9DVS7_9BACL|nr:beta-galactosidase [Paenibacillus thalictri]TBL79903.1 glycoside hydrolase [Paenibacillus thalictri]